MRWFWRIYWPATFIAIGIVIASAYMGRIEGWGRPIFAVGSIPVSSVIRSDGYLCWTWVTDKLRASAAEDIDAVLERPAIGDLSWPEVIDAHTHHVWHRLGSRPPTLGIHYDSCVRLPDDLSPSEPIRLTQTLFYPSAFGPWRVEVHPPDVISPGRTTP